MVTLEVGFSHILVGNGTKDRFRANHNSVTLGRTPNPGLIKYSPRTVLGRPEPSSAYTVRCSSLRLKFVSCSGQVLFFPVRAIKRCSSGFRSNWSGFSVRPTTLLSSSSILLPLSRSFHLSQQVCRAAAAVAVSTHFPHSNINHTKSYRTS